MTEVEEPKYWRVIDPVQIHEFVRVQLTYKFHACPWKDAFAKPLATGTVWWKFSGKNVFTVSSIIKAK